MFLNGALCFRHRRLSRLYSLPTLALTFIIIGLELASLPATSGGYHLRCSSSDFQISSSGPIHPVLGNWRSFLAALETASPFPWR